MVVGKRLVPMLAAVMALGLTAGAGSAMAHEGGGHGDGAMWLLARAAGLSHDQIATAFKSDTNLQTDRTNLQNARDAMVTCIVSGNSCSSQISAYTTALQTMEQEKLNVWQTLFKQAPNPSQASTVLSELQQLRATRKQIFQQVFGNGQSGSSSSSPSSSPAATETPAAPQG